jgi:hypothetical protein
VERDGGHMLLIWLEREAEYFWREGWTTQISLIRFENFRFTRKSV